MAFKKGISNQGFQRLARLYKSSIKGSYWVYWDEDNNPDDAGWVWEDPETHTQRAVSGDVGRDPDASLAELKDEIAQDPFALDDFSIAYRE